MSSGLARGELENRASDGSDHFPNNAGSLREKLATLRFDEEPRRRAGRWWLLALVVLALAAAAFFAHRRARAPVVVTTVRPTVLTATQAAAGQPLLTAAGYLVPRRRAIVSSKIQGRLAELRVEEGSRVAAGEVIARLESGDFAAQVARAEAAIVRAEAGVERARADLAEARRQLRHTETLSTAGVMAKNDREAGESRVAIAVAALAQAEGEVATTRAEREVARAYLQNTIIVAPFAGTVVKKTAEVGESVAPIPPGVNISTASGAIVALADLETLEAEVDVGEANVAKLIEGQPTLIAVEAFPEREYRGVLRQILPSADRTKATVQVRVTLLDKDPRLKPEMSARADFVERQPELGPPEQPPVITVPQEVLAQRGGHSVVFAVESGRVRALPVSIAGQLRGATIVTQGLAGGELLVLHPPSTLTDGAVVEVR